MVFLPAFALGACGGGSRQDANEPSGVYDVAVQANFPDKQALAEKSVFSVDVRNASSKTIPNVAVTVDSFATASTQAGLADPHRPVWIVDNGPRGAGTAYTNTWAAGKLDPGETHTFQWRVTAVRYGVHTVKYRVAAGLNGKAKAQLASGQSPEGSFTVDISRKPSNARVDPATGKVIRTRKS